ncbi:MAG: MBL fold metallo-hydrolase [Phycisphaerales bacterium]
MEAPRSETILPAHGLRVFASGSMGNCSLLRVTLEGSPRHYLIDLGLSPRRTRTHLAACGLTLHDLEGVFITHFDSDHCHPGWCTAIEPALPRHVEIFLHRSHLRRSQRLGLQAARFAPFRDGFNTPSGLPVRVVLSAHDELGASVFRISTPGGELGFATDLGRATDALVSHLRGVHVLAIESNYCPDLELSSGRPPQLIRRVMGGHGHLSNEQAFEAIRHIAPRDHVVLLHLSQECNTPDLARRLHEGLGYPLTISLQHEPTPWVPLARAGDAATVTLRPRLEQAMLFR